MHEVWKYEWVFVGGVKVKEAREKAAGDSVNPRKQTRILAAFGKFEFDPGYDYKAERNRVKRQRRDA